MTSLTVTPKPAYAAALIEITGAQAGPCPITRTDNNGVHLVRLAPGQEPVAGSMTVFDFEAALTGAVTYSIIGTRTNSVTNPSLEVNTSSWLAIGGTLTRVTSEHWDGVAAGQFVSGAGGGCVSNDAVCVAGQTWTVSAYVKGTGTFRAVIGYTGSAGLNWRDVTLTSAWQRVSVSQMIPTGATGVHLSANLNGAGTLYFDGAMVEQVGEVQPYIAGTITDLPITATTTLGVTFPYLTCAVSPSAIQQLVSVTGYDASRAYAGTVHQVIDRPDPLVTPSPLGWREGSLEIWCGSYEDALSTIDVASTGDVMMLRQPTFRGMDMYFVPRSASLAVRSTETASVRWGVNIAYTEVASPDGSLLSAAGWTWDELAASFATWDDVAAYFATWNAVAAGP